MGMGIKVDIGSFNILYVGRVLREERGMKIGVTLGEIGGERRRGRP